MILTVYVPAGPGLPIRDGSGIVGSPVDEGARLRIDYEGNVYASPALRTYATRVFHAAVAISRAIRPSTSFRRVRRRGCAIGAGAVARRTRCH